MPGTREPNSIAPVRFLLGHDAVALSQIDPTTTLLDYLRETAGRKGTKEGCAEGDCGACTVVVAELAGKELTYRAVNACIQFVGALHGKQVLTVEDLAAPDGTPHPVQAAMVAEHGSQCGFCTPGFVMSLFAVHCQQQRLDRRALNNALAGNLCRCTGYGPILAAGESMWDAEGRDDHLTGREAEVITALSAWATDRVVGLRAGDRALLAPATVDQLAELLLDHPEATLLAGGTDVGLWVTKQLRRPGTLVYTGRIAELARIEDANDALHIGGAARLTEAAAAIGGYYPDFGEVFRRYGSVQVRNAGTLGGNVANGSPIGDGPPGLIALDAELVLRRGDARRRMSIERFFIDYGKQDRQQSEFIEKIVVPKPKATRQFRMYKISKRFDQDISALCGAFALDIADGIVTDARIAYGGMAAIPKRAAGAEAALRGQPWTQATVADAMAALDGDYEPLTDMRSSAAYRREAARNLLQRAYLHSTSGDTPLNILDCEAA